MVQETLIALFTRDLGTLKSEIAAYKDETRMWKVSGDLTNSAGNLCLHLIGNINHFFGALIAQNGFVRDREAEFGSTNVSREEMLSGIDNAIEVMRGAIAGISDSELGEVFPIMHRDKEVTMIQMLLHLSTHLNYHLGQINYHRRLLG